MRLGLVDGKPLSSPIVEFDIDDYQADLEFVDALRLAERHHVQIFGGEDQLLGRRRARHTACVREIEHHDVCAYDDGLDAHEGILEVFEVDAEIRSCLLPSRQHAIHVTQPCHLGWRPRRQEDHIRRYISDWGTVADELEQGAIIDCFVVSRV